MSTYNQHDLINAVVKYRTKRTRLKVKQRQQLADALRDDLADVGEQIALARAAGATVDEVAADFGGKNRTFVYEALGAYQERVATLPEVTDEPEVPAKGYSIRPTPGTGNYDSYTVTLDGMEYLVQMDADGTIAELPEAWLTSPSRERRDLIKEIIRDIEE